MSVNNPERHEMTCTGCHKRVAVKGARMCQRCLNIAHAEAQLSALEAPEEAGLNESHYERIAAEMSEARNV
jgi:hypothetical protein